MRYRWWGDGGVDDIDTHAYVIGGAGDEFVDVAGYNGGVDAGASGGNEGVHVRMMLGTYGNISCEVWRCWRNKLVGTARPTAARSGRTDDDRISVSPTTTNPDWPMAGSPDTGPSKRHLHHHHQHAHVHPHHQRISNVNTRPQASDEDQDDMVLG